MTKEQKEKLTALKEKLMERQNACNRAMSALAKAEMEKFGGSVGKLLDEAEAALK